MKIEMTQLIAIAKSKFRVALLALRAAFDIRKLFTATAMGSGLSGGFKPWITALDPHPSAAIRGHPSPSV